MKIQLRVDERGALRNGRYAFTNKLTLVSELLQNARRAGATQVTIEHDAAGKHLAVIDDGCGIEDFQRLLTFNESGWDEDTVRTEHAFGLGFSKCLYAASRVTVTSRGQRLAFECDDALNQAELDVEPAPDADPGLTTVELDGVDLPLLDQMIDRITRGFALPVIYNGVSQARSHSLTALPFSATEIGQVHLWGIDGGEPARASVLYLQGLPIANPDRHLYWDRQHLDVIHLDGAAFVARMPDRTELIDAEEQCKRIDGAIRQLWRSVLEDRKRKLPAAEFVDRYYTAAQRQNLLEVFDDVPVVPRQACSVVVDYPTLADERERYLQEPDGHPKREDVENGSIRLAAFDPYIRDNPHATLMYARAAGLTLVHAYWLGSAHWVNRRLRDLDLENIEVVAVGPGAEARLDGLFVCEQLRLCERIEVRHGHDTVSISGDALFDGAAILYPAGCRNGDVVKQVSTYTGEDDHFDDTACEEDMRRLQRLVCTLRCADPASVLRCLLQDLPLNDYAALVGRTFRVAVGTSAAEASVDLVS